MKPATLPHLLAAVTDCHADLRLAACSARLRPGERLAGWTLRAAWTEDETHFAALENADETAILANAAPRVRARIARSFGDPASLQRQTRPGFDQDRLARLLDSPRDDLARAVLRRGEPSFGAVADSLPPVLDMTFLGDDRALERAIVRADGAIEGYFASPFAPDTLPRHGLLGEGCNILCYARWEAEAQVGVEMVAFALADGPSGELAVYRRLRRVSSQGESVIHERSCEGTERLTWRFYSALLQAYERDQAFFARGAQVRVPEAQVHEGLRASLRLGDLTFRGVLPRYGVGQYDQKQHNSFPPATIFLAWTHLEWGRLDRARDILSHYLSRYVTPDGSFDYYGPAVAEYGQMLSLCARYAQLSAVSPRRTGVAQMPAVRGAGRASIAPGDAREWWHGHLPIIRRLVSRLLALRHASQARHAGDVRHCGLIPGLPEADYHGDEREWRKHYFAGDVWVCRGLREVGRRLAEDPVTRAEGQRLLTESVDYQHDINAAAWASVDRERRFCPAGPDEPPPFDRMTESNHASYCNYRYLLEMLSAGILDRRLVRMVLRYRRTHGGELLGMTRFGDHLDDWPAWHCARGLLDLDDVAGYQMLLYGHLAHHQSRGNWAAYEQVAICPAPCRPDPAQEQTGSCPESDERLRVAQHHTAAAHRTVAGRAEQVVPCQVMSALMLKHMLVDEDRDADILHLLRACPAAWLQSREGLTVGGMPTRWGPVRLAARRFSGKLRISLDLQFSAAVPGDVLLRLPGADPSRVSADRGDWSWGLRPGFLCLHAPLPGRYALQVSAHGDRR